MRKAFLEFLAAEGIITDDVADNLQSLLRGVPEPIGSIAFSYGMITTNDIDVILDEQRKDYRPFGEIAMDMGMLRREQVETLLRIQQVRGATDTAEALALSGVCSVEETLKHLSRFLTSDTMQPVVSEK